MTAVVDEEGLVAFVDDVRARPERRDELVPLLREESPLYDGRGTVATARMRGWILLAFEHVGLPDDAAPFVAEELESGREPYLVGAAARALRGYGVDRAAPFAPLLVRAIENVRRHDDALSFAAFGAIATSPGATTAVNEALRALAWLGPRAAPALPALAELLADPHRELSPVQRDELARTVDAIRDAPRVVAAACACAAVDPYRSLAGARAPGDAELDALELEDQDGHRATFAELFRGKPSIVTFFYTRCDNPNKCSLTVTRLAGLQRRLARDGLGAQIRTAAISYDPAYDLPKRVHDYGASRGVIFDADHRMLRAPGGVDVLRRRFGLGVNFAGSIVNRHKIELFVLDREGRPVASFTRAQWDDERVLSCAREMLEARTVRALAARAIGVAPAAAFALLPKCPLCWAAYLSAFGIVGVEHATWSRWLLPLLVALMLVNLVVVALRARGALGRLGLAAAALGALVLILHARGVELPHAALLGAALTSAGSFMSVGRAGGWGRATSAPRLDP